MEGRVISIKEAVREFNTRIAVAAKLMRSVPMKTTEQLAEDRVAWGKKFARLVKKHGWKALEKMPTTQLTAEFDGRDGIRVQHVRVDGRWETRRFERVRVRSCKGKRT